MKQNEAMCRIRVNEALREGLEAQRIHRMLTESADRAQPTQTRPALLKLANSLRSLWAGVRLQRQDQRARWSSAKRPGGDDDGVFVEPAEKCGVAGRQV